MNSKLELIHQNDIEEIANLVAWYREESIHDTDEIVHYVAEDVLESIRFDDIDRYDALDAPTMRQVVRIVEIATRSAH